MEKNKEIHQVLKKILKESIILSEKYLFLKDNIKHHLAFKNIMLSLKTNIEDNVIYDGIVKYLENEIDSNFWKRIMSLEQDKELSMTEINNIIESCTREVEQKLPKDNNVIIENIIIKITEIILPKHL